MKNMSNEQFEHEMNIISNLKEVGAPNFFYTRLKARMEKEKLSNELANPLKPILVICALTLFLFINSLLLKNNSNIVNTNSSQEMEAFAASYDQTISN
ncbi:MAG: hypothetical protein RL262_813 [Bacteroidota bacterium]